MTTTTITDRIRKLLALSESPNENEAALAAEKAQELALKHGIELATVAMEEDQTIRVDDAELHRSTFDPWRRMLMGEVARSFGGEVIFRGYGRSWTACVYTPHGTAEACVELYRYLETQLTTISAVATAKREETWVHGRTYRSSFLYGAVMRIGGRLQARRAAMEAEASADTSKALVVVKSAVEKYVEERHPNVRSENYRPQVDGGAYRAGSAAGANVSLGGARVGSGRGALPAGCGA